MTNKEAYSILFYTKMENKKQQMALNKAFYYFERAIIPKKVFPDASENPTLHCRGCLATVDPKYHEKFCGFCGQALDWEVIIKND